jgi:hypothetical protein
MQARAHLKLIVSEPTRSAPDEGGQDRVSRIVPVRGFRTRQHWLRHHGASLALWATSIVLLSLSIGILLGRW